MVGPSASPQKHFRVLLMPSSSCVVVKTVKKAHPVKLDKVTKARVGESKIGLA